MWSTVSPWTLFSAPTDASDSTPHETTPINSSGRITLISERAGDRHICLGITPDSHGRLFLVPNETLELPA